MDDQSISKLSDRGQLDYEPAGLKLPAGNDKASRQLRRRYRALPRSVQETLARLLAGSWEVTAIVLGDGADGEGTTTYAVPEEVVYDAFMEHLEVDIDGDGAGIGVQWRRVERTVVIGMGE